MSSLTHPSPGDTSRLTLLNGALIVAASLGIFAAAYAIGGIFGRSADNRAGGSDARVVAAVEPSGTPLLTLRAKDVVFDTKTIAVAAGEPAQVRVENEDAGIFHNIAVYRDTQASHLVARGKLFDGPRTRDYHFNGFEAGTYYFQCDLHPAMNGTLTSK